MNAIRYLFGLKGPTGFGSRSTAEDVCSRYSVNVKGKVVVVTGWTSGIGYETARVMAKHGASLILVGREVSKMETLAKNLSRSFPDAQLYLVECDLASLASVRRAAATILEQFDHIHCLINNGGVSCCPPKLTADGLEEQFATNVAGHFLLTSLLLPLLEKGGTVGEPARVVNVASKAHTIIKSELKMLAFTSVDDYQLRGGVAYALSKLCNILHAKELNRRCVDAGGRVVAFSLHPGGVSTGVMRHLFSPWVQWLLLDVAFRPFMKTIPQGAATQVYLAVAPLQELVPGGYYQDCNQIAPSSVASDPVLAVKLWDELVRLTTAS